MVEKVAHRVSIYLTHEEYKMLQELTKAARGGDQRGKTSQSYILAVALRRMHKELLGQKEGSW